MNLHKTTPWQTALIKAVTDPKELLELLELDNSLLSQARAAATLFPLKVPHGFIARMQKGKIDDPLLRQVLPIDAELQNIPGYTTDPLREKNVNPLPGLLHKYPGRVLLTLTGACAINCRFCFRRHFSYEDNNPGMAGWEQTLEYIKQDKTLTEVILSGGDPLILNDHRLHELTQKLSAITHLKRLRIHSRIPIILPERMTSELITGMTHPHLKTILVVHCNHPNEINSAVSDAMQPLTRAGITLLNQSVLLKGINDNSATLIALSEALFASGIQPYYLHVLDKVQGTAHFDLARRTALQLHHEIAQQLSGYLVPKLVCETSGKLAKTPINPEFFYTD